MARRSRTRAELAIFGRLLWGATRRPSPRLHCTDGACEEASPTFSGISISAVLFSPAGSAQFFGTEVSRVCIDKLRHQKQVVGEAELLPLVVSRYTA